MVETEKNSKSPQPAGEISFDFDGDGVPDLTIRKTNGHSAYINVKWLITALAGVVTTVIAFLQLS